MINSRKKGFTLVELVIVIAVIAILAAVLIPTFSSLIRKANISSDTVLAKNLNTALQVYDAEKDVKEFDDALEGIKEAGYLIANLNAKTTGCFFVWEKDTNQILLVDSKDGYKVLFSVKDGYGDADESWHFAISNKDVAAQVATELPNVTIKQTVANIVDFKEILNSGQDQEIYIDESVILNKDTTIKVENGKEITIKLGNSTLSTNGTITGVPVNAVNGTLIVDGGFIGASGNFTNEHGTFSTAVGFEGTGKLVLKNVNISGVGNAVAGANAVDGPAEIEIYDSTLVGSTNGFNLSTWGTAVLNNVSITAPKTITASYGATITINGGKYVSNNILIDLYRQNDSAIPTEKATVTINDGEFIFTNNLFVFNTSNTQVIINGGTFNGVDYLTYFEALNGSQIGGGTVYINGNSVIISK